MSSLQLGLCFNHLSFCLVNGGGNAHPTLAPLIRFIKMHSLLSRLAYILCYPIEMIAASVYIFVYIRCITSVLLLSMNRILATLQRLSLK